MCDDQAEHLEEIEPEPPKSGPKLWVAMTTYAVLALLATFTLDGNFRLVVWIFLAGLALKTYIAKLQKP